MASPRDLVTAVFSEHGRRFMKYCSVSVFNVALGQGLLLFFHSIVGFAGWLANISAIVVGTVPSYLLSRRWVWEKRGNHSLRGEMLPFWGLNFVGAALSTLFVGVADVLWDNALLLVVASIGAWSIVWIVKYVTMDRMVFRRKRPATVAA